MRPARNDHGRAVHDQFTYVSLASQRATAAAAPFKLVGLLHFLADVHSSQKHARRLDVPHSLADAMLLACALAHAWARPAFWTDDQLALLTLLSIALVQDNPCVPEQDATTRT
jgi:hypothetical protein